MNISPLSPSFLASRGACCGSGCQNCPYIPRHTLGSTRVDEEWVTWKEVHREEPYDSFCNSSSRTDSVGDDDRV